MSTKRKSEDEEDTKPTKNKKGKYLSDIKFDGVDDSTFAPTDPDGIPACFLLCAVGPPGSGKTHNMVTYISKLAEMKDIHKIYILSPTWHNNKGYFYDKMGKPSFKVPYEICEDIKGAWGFLSKVEKEQLEAKTLWKEIKKQYDNLQKFEQFITILKRNMKINDQLNMRAPNFNKTQPYSLDEAAKKYMNSKNIKEKMNLLTKGEEIMKAITQMGSVKEFYEKPPMALMFCDDIQGTKLMSTSPTSPFMNFLIKHRHYFCNVMFGVHSIASGLPSTVRAQITDWMVFRVKNPKLIERIHDEVIGNEADYDDFEDFYKTHIDGENNRFLMVNKKSKPIQGRLDWGMPGEKLGLKDMIETHKKLSNEHKEKNDTIAKTSFPFKGKNNKTHQFKISFSKPIEELSKK